MFRAIIDDQERTAKALCPQCGIWHRYDYCPKCGHPTPWFEAVTVNERETSNKRNNEPDKS